MTNKNLIDLEAMSVEQVGKLVKKARKIMQSPADYRHACDGTSHVFGDGIGRWRALLAVFVQAGAPRRGIAAEMVHVSLRRVEEHAFHAAADALLENVTHDARPVRRNLPAAGLYTLYYDGTAAFIPVRS